MPWPEILREGENSARWLVLTSKFEHLQTVDWSCWWLMGWVPSPAHTLSTTSSSVPRIPWKIQNIYVFTFNFWEEETMCFSGACIHQEGTGACSAKASGSWGPELDSAFIQRQSGLQTGHILVMILQEGLQLSPVVVPFFKCECSIKATGNFCEVNPKKQPLCGSCHFIDVPQGVLELNI